MDREEEPRVEVFDVPNNEQGQPNAGESNTAEKMGIYTRSVRNGLISLRNDHISLLANIKNEDVPGDDSDWHSSRLNDSLNMLNAGVNETSLMLLISQLLEQLESQKCLLNIKLVRVEHENVWLREELSFARNELSEALIQLEELKLEKRKRDFEDELSGSGSKTGLRPITPSRIPVGSFRVEEERAINRAVLGSNHRSLSPLPKALPSRIPLRRDWAASNSKELVAYNRVMEKQDMKASLASKERNVRQYFHLVNGSSNTSSPCSSSKIPSR